MPPQTFQVGVNIPSIASYGYGDIRPYAPAGEVAADLAEVQRMGGTVVRVWVGNDLIGDSEAARRLGVFLDTASTYGISAIVTFIDYYWSKHEPAAAFNYYTDQWNGLRLLNDSFFESGYQTALKPFVQTVVTANRNRSNIYAWEIGNELKDTTNPAALVNFMGDMASFVHGLDPGHLIATGMLDAAHTGLDPASLYASLSNVNIITIHPTVGATAGLADVAWAVQNGKLAIVEETGLPASGGRGAAYAAALNYWRSQGAVAFLPWAFIARGLGDNGDGDTGSGFDTIWHSDYNDIFAALASAAPAPPTPTPTLAPSPTIAPTRTATATPTTTRTPTTTPTPSSTPTPTSTPNCAPRPRVSTAVSPGSSGTLSVTIQARAANNALRSLQFGADANGLIDVPGVATGSSGNLSVPLPRGTTSTSFTIRRAAPGAVTVSLVVSDGCGSWPTFVGGGPAAF